MHRTETVTMLTDYALGALAALWSAVLLVKARSGHHKSVALWGIGFAGLALGSIAAGTYHGFPEALGARAVESLWGFVTWTMACASCCMLCGAVIALAPGVWRTGLLALALIKLAIYAICAAGRDEYAFVVLDYGSAQLLILLLTAYAWRRERAASAPWLAAGIGVSGIGALVQQSGLALHAHFNQNDLYHVIQMVGLFLLYRGGTLFTDRA